MRLKKGESEKVGQSREVSILMRGREKFRDEKKGGHKEEEKKGGD